MKIEEVFGELSLIGKAVVLKTTSNREQRCKSSSLLLSSIMVQILRKQGWTLNPNDKTVNSIIRMIENNDGKCPCHNTSADTQCPCSNYREHDICECGLYLKINS